MTVAYALDALDADERRAYEEHLVDCERCRDELGGLAGGDVLKHDFQPGKILE